MMNTRANAIPEPAVESQVIAPVTVSVTQRFYWSVQREIWEHRSIYVAPLAAAALVMIGFLIAATPLGANVELASAHQGVQQHTIDGPYELASLLIMFVTFVVAVFYSLDALYGERRDRSLLFWKSMPVSDVTTVLSKASIPLVVLPLLTFVITVGTHWMMLLISSLAMHGSGLSLAALWTNLSLPAMWLMLLYHLLAIHSLWYAPMYAYLLMVSAWARRAPVLWAALPLLAIGIVEKIAFNTSHFAAMLQYRFYGPGSMTGMTGSMSASLTRVTPGQFLTTPGLWIGLAVTAAFLAAAVRLRRNQGAI